MVLECLGVWLHVFGLVNAEAIHFISTHSSCSLWSTCLGGIKEACT